MGGGLEAEPWREFVRECDAFRLEDNGQRSRTNKAMILWLFNDMLVSLMRTKAKRGPKLVVKHCASLFKSIAFLTEVCFWWTEGRGVKKRAMVCSSCR